MIIFTPSPFSVSSPLVFFLSSTSLFSISMFVLKSSHEGQHMRVYISHFLVLAHKVDSLSFIIQIVLHWTRHTLTHWFHLDIRTIVLLLSHTILFYFLRNSLSVFHPSTNVHAHQQCASVLFLHILTIFTFHLFGKSHLNKLVSIFISPMINDVEKIFIHLLAILYVLFCKKKSVEVHCPFSSNLFSYWVFFPKS